MSINGIWDEPFSNVSVDSKLGDMAAKVAVQNFDYRYATLLFYNTTLSLGVDLFLRAFNYNIFVSRGILNLNFTKITHQYVIFGSDVTEIILLLDILDELEIKTNGKFIIVCQSQISNDCDEAEMTKLFWEHKIVDVVVIKSEGEEPLGYTYYPISDDDCNNIKPIKLKSLNASDNFIATANHGNVFGMKLKKLNFCPLFASTFIQTPYMNITKGRPVGADGDLLRIIAYGLNTTIEIMTPQDGGGWGVLQRNGTWTGSLADVYDDLANISMTTPALILSRFLAFQTTHSYSSLDIIWVTHPAMLQNEALKLLRPFGYRTRIALAVSYLIVILCAFVVKSDRWSSIYCRTQEHHVSKSVVFYSWMICMGQALIKLPTKSALLQITILWVYYCFLIRTAYQVYLISALKGKFYEDHIETIEDAMEAKYPFGGGAALRDYFIDYPEIYNNWITIDTAEIVPTLLNISKGQKFVLAMGMDTAKVVIKKHKVKFYMLPGIIVSSPTVIFLKKHSPLTESINLVLSRLITSGFPEKLRRDYTVKSIASECDNQEETLKVIHLTACYIVLIIGWLLSFVFFSLEFYFGKVYKHPICTVIA